MKKINSDDFKKLGLLESESAYILDVYEHKVRYKHLKNIAYKLGLIVNKYTLLTYILVGVINVLLIEFNTNLTVLFSLLLITLFALDKSHKFYLRETIRTSDSKITIARNRYSKLK